GEPVAGGAAARLDELADSLPLLGPAVGMVVRELAVAREPDPAVEGDPRHQLRDRVVAEVGKLPDARVLVPPHDAEPVERRADPLPRRLVERVALAEVQVNGLEQVAPRPELELRLRCVAVPHRARVAVPAQRKLLEPR